MLKGTLDDFTLPDIFRLLSQSKKTGSLEVERSAGRGNVYFKEGDVYFAESSLSKELLGQKLVKAKVLTSGQLMKALDQQATSGGRLGDVLLSTNLVFEEQLEAALRGQIEDAVFDLLRWELGEFTWTAGETVEPEVSLSVSVENLIMEAARRLDELEVIRRKIPSELTILTMASTPPEGAVEINITPEEWRVMVLVNGSRTVLEIAETVGLDVFQTMRTLYGLVSSGLIDMPEGASSDPEPLELSEEAHEVEMDEPEPAAEVAVEEFDAPAPGELLVEAEAPAGDEPAAAVGDPVAEEGPEDPFAGEILTAEPAEAHTPSPVAGVAAEDEPTELDHEEVATDIPVSAGTSVDDEATVDKSAAVRELSNLFKQNDTDTSPSFIVPPVDSDAPEDKRRVEDDEEITRGLISRLIDGVKGL